MIHGNDAEQFLGIALRGFRRAIRSVQATVPFDLFQYVACYPDTVTIVFGQVIS